MANPSQATDGQVADAVKGNWVDTRAPAWSRPYLRLSRADRPIGTWLLLLPCWWGLLLASAHTGSFTAYDAWIALGCAIGAFLMRGAGCTWNDITDRDFDAAVARTRSRPIPSGQVTVRQALVWLVIQSLLAFGILLTFPPAAIALGVASLALVAIYPFAKRFTWWPQVFLGLAFNWGALLAWTAHTGSLAWPAVVLWLGGHRLDAVLRHDLRPSGQGGRRADRREVHRAPLRRPHAPLAAHLPRGDRQRSSPSPSWARSSTRARSRSPSPSAVRGRLGWHLAWQLANLDPDDPANCLRLFRSNREAGLIPVPFLAAAILL